MNVLEDLKISNMKKRCKPKQDEHGNYIKNGQSAKRVLNDAISDAGWYQLRKKIEHQSKKQGKKHVVVDPKFTSIGCPKCHHVDASNRDGEKFICTNPDCNYIADADNNAGTNIAHRAIGTAQLNSKVRIVEPEFTPKIRLRRNHKHRLMSLGRRTNQQNKLRHTEKIVLNCWIQKFTISSDSKTIT